MTEKLIARGFVEIWSDRVKAPVTFDDNGVSYSVTVDEKVIWARHVSYGSRRVVREAVSREQDDICSRLLRKHEQPGSD